MKFRDGMWLTSDQFTVQYAEEVYAITPREDKKAVTLLCPTKKILRRGDTLNMPTLDVEIEAQFDDVISIEVTRFSGARRLGPNFDIFPDGKPESNGSVSTSEKGTTVTSGNLSATVSSKEHTFDINFHTTDGSKSITSLPARSIGSAYSPALKTPKQVEDLRNHEQFVFTQTDLGVGESIHGLGERFGAWNKVGQNIEVWNEDGGTSSEQAYKNVSFWLSSKGYGVFIDTPQKIDLEIGSERCSRLQTTVAGQRLKWYLIYGPTPKEVLTKYSILTGKPGKVPAWSFGLWLSTSFTTNYDEKTVRHFVETMQESKIPLEVFHFDCFWLRAFHWTDFVWDPEYFPDPSGFIGRLKKGGLTNKISVWTNSYIGQASPVFKYAAEKGYLLKRTNGDIWQWDMWQTGMGIVDFTNPEACDWYTGCLEKLFDVGVDCIKTDFGERIPTKDVVWFDKTVDPERMHNYYAFIYNKLVFEALQRRYGKHEAVLFARTACAGNQRFPLQWGGDCESTPAALAESLRGGLGLGLASFASWSNDIGGFEGYPPPWIYKRWVTFGLLCSHSRLHGSSSYRVPWLIDDSSTEPENCTEVLRHWVQFKRRLMPYFYAQSIESVANGWPTSVRAVALEFPDDPTSWFLDRQFMIGSQIIAAPIFSEDGTGEVYLPPGRWFNFWDGKEVAGSQWIREKYNFLQTPAFVREGTVLVLGQGEGEGGFGYDWVNAGGVVRLYGTKEGDKAVVVDAQGEQKVVLEVTSENEVKGLDVLGGEWTVERFG
ncbi:glycoside hydrolase family 31 protein [Aaosphaeria arxii CBS 175.79]|uniref:alpha-D-xyloside xylohydrolase n=1 Tax=Aaosphaeria arxii CBS 175.79 TaxID=1450172 RepID=A0A6A5XYB6_9PLEO|nr:glycoside hydrolase family 31 protein [Aaosphaeria arxii CBS 175.79]KAF2017956.1 glycoside hydrolase family 31 protein [Aaosphaeria arxii CBS 175.79]